MKKDYRYLVIHYTNINCVLEFLCIKESNTSFKIKQIVGPSYKDSKNPFWLMKSQIDFKEGKDYQIIEELEPFTNK